MVIQVLRSLFENSAFCRKISEILREYCGKPIHEIGDIELSQRSLKITNAVKIAAKDAEPLMR
jgi:hypothetical protein